MRRVYLDGRKPFVERVLARSDLRRILDGSLGRRHARRRHRRALSSKSFIDGSSPHSDKMTVHERIRLVEPGVLEDQITVRDPEALTEPWQITPQVSEGLLSE